MIKINLYKYDSTASDYKGEDLSAYILQGAEDTEKLNNEIDITQITLQGYPTREEFAPETMFILEVQDDTATYTLDRIVQNDYVSQPILSDNAYFNHIISLEEPSAIAQKRVVDNIATTYKLKDVSLNTRTVFDLELETSTQLSDYNGLATPPYSFGDVDTTSYKMQFWGKQFLWEKPSVSGGTKYFYTYDINDNTSTAKYYISINNDSVYKDGIKFALPKPRICLGFVKEYYNYDFIYASFDWKIEDYNEQGILTNTYNGKYISNSTFTNTVGYNPTLPLLVKQNWLPEKAYVPTSQIQGYYVKKYSDSSGINFSGQNLFTDTIEVNENHKYILTVSLHNFDDEVPQNAGLCFKHSGNPVSSAGWYSTRGSGYKEVAPTYMDYNNYNGSTEVYTYKESDIKAVLTSGTPYSAYSLMQKAILNSGTYFKKDGISCNDTENTETECPFYIDSSAQEELLQTQVNEAFYNQKNLWEIALEVGKYIHAIPELKFGDNNKFKFVFNKLGSTDQKNDVGTKITITNFKGIEDYISSCTSYITNMVQLGGVITEYLPFKTIDENYLIFNDKAQAITSKPIIELLELKVICTKEFSASGNTIAVGDIADITKYVYEENVWKLLSINYNDEPNKGLALYYRLGENAILSGQYQLPQESTNIYSDYAIKKVIYSGYFNYPIDTSLPTNGYWTNLCVNDFVFKITYRTKDSVRQDQTRPDLRKYLLNSKFDRVPQHYQFNNQEDILVDSDAFGQNIYGKLIRTGNTSYEITEWNNNLADIKHKGELFRIYDDLYYVSQVKHTFYSNYIASKITYSKDYNELSPVVGIPSEPRFYEISEQSSIVREVSLNDYLIATTDTDQISQTNGFITDFSHLKDLLFNDGATYLTYAKMTFKSDNDTDNSGTWGEVGFSKNVLLPINAYSSANTLTYEWDTVDNFSAGDKVIDATYDREKADDRYKSLEAVRYTDKYGKAPLIDFGILKENPFAIKDTATLAEISATLDEISNLPEMPDKTYDMAVNGNNIILLKDCRESLSFNYNLQLITSSDTFVISPFFFAQNKTNLHLVFLSEEVNKLYNGYIPSATLLTIDNAIFHELIAEIDEDLNCIKVSLPQNITNEDFAKIKSIAIVYDYDTSTNLPTNLKVVFSRNIPNTYTKAQALANWYFGLPNKDNVFTNKQ